MQLAALVVQKCAAAPGVYLPCKISFTAGESTP
jgi:hypothetical protein